VLKRLNPNLSEGQDTGNEATDLDEKIKADVRGHVRNAGSWKKLAEISGVSYSTIANLAYGDTANPQQRTLTKLMVAMGYGEALSKAYDCETPVYSVEAQATAPSAVWKRRKKRLSAKAQTAAQKAAAKLASEKKGNK